ncbi:MAG: tRNA preQ1(34) S-adenosylmethionine ribosyltransferase-isomerase QueA [Phycisphaeraceae bacterium]|nr:tRNA preQ1(34) S-adenosylmethionine ribosyltransferase-isomerase QueA [Phycisphaerales bacterium]MCB9860119.1 tRNA preQ1(34) S-adenosylmethionine ribosyltransferase-isomerase QueA [Phycisphaeraceae bacterium]
MRHRITEQALMRTSELDYHLPEGCIATEPARPRDSAKLMVIRRSSPANIEHLAARDLPEFLSSGDILLSNRTTVLRARLEGFREGSTGRISGLFLGPSEDSTPGVWRALLKMNRAQPGKVVRLTDRNDQPSPYSLHLIEKLDDEPGGWIVNVHHNDVPLDPSKTTRVLDEVGRTPLPPYILATRNAHNEQSDDTRDAADYSTVFQQNKPDAHGSVAAPTAGLHFTQELLAKLHTKGIHQKHVTLHVGTGTFRTIETETVEDHPMHTEWCSMDRNTVNDVRSCDGLRVAIGTTTVRTLESYAAHMLQHNEVPASISTKLLITPGYEFKWTDALLTNFHLPRSTLLALVAAMLPGGIEQLKSLYEIAIENKYRFYSFGDAMLILP